MEHVIAEVLKRCAGFDIWYKLYADDLVVTVSHQHLEEFLAILHELSHCYELIINPNKHTIFGVKTTKNNRENGLERHSSRVRILLLRSDYG